MVPFYFHILLFIICIELLATFKIVASYLVDNVSTNSVQQSKVVVVHITHHCLSCNKNKIVLHRDASRED